MSEKNLDGYQALGWIINRSESGLFLAVADELIQMEIVEVYRHGRIGIYDCRQNPGGYSFQTLKQWIDAQSGIDTFFVINFHLAIQNEEDIRRLNFSRDMLAGLEKNLIFFTTAYGDDSLATGAYDFYSFIKIRVIFEEHAVEEKWREEIQTLDIEEEWRTQTGLQGEPRQQLTKAYALVQQAKKESDTAKYQESLRLLWKAAKIYEEILGSEHLETASVYYEMAEGYVNMDQYGQASEQCGRALDIRKKVLGENHPMIAACYDLQALIYERQGRYREAEELSSRAVSMCVELLGAEHPKTVLSCHNLAVIYEKQGKYEEAERLYRQVLAVTEKVLGKQNSDVAVTYNSLAIIYLRQKKYGQAEGLLEKTLAILKEVLPEYHPHIADTYNNLAFLYEHQNKEAEAEEMYRKAITIYKVVCGGRKLEGSSDLL